MENNKTIIKEQEAGFYDELEDVEFVGAPKAKPKRPEDKKKGKGPIGIGEPNKKGKGNSPVPTGIEDPEGDIDIPAEYPGGTPDGPDTPAPPPARPEKKPPEQKPKPKPKPKTRKKPKKQQPGLNKDPKKPLEDPKNMSPVAICKELASYMSEEELSIVEDEAEKFFIINPEAKAATVDDGDNIEGIKYGLGLWGTWFDPIIDPKSNVYTPASLEREPAQIYIRKFNEYKKFIGTKVFNKNPEEAPDFGTIAKLTMAFGKWVYLFNLSRNIRIKKGNASDARNAIRDALDQGDKKFIDLDKAFETILESKKGDKSRKTKLLKELISGEEKMANRTHMKFSLDVFKKYNYIANNVLNDISNDGTSTNNTQVAEPPGAARNAPRESITIDKNHIKQLIKEAFTDNVYGKYPYSHRVGNEDEPKEDYVEDWKKFCLGIVQDKSKEQAIALAKIFIQDLELFEDVLDLAGQNQSIGSEILKKMQKNQKNMV